MQRIERVKAIAEKYGSSLAEYLLMHVATAFAMTEEEATKFVTKALAASPHAGDDVQDALRACFEKKWLEFTPARLLALTHDGRVVTHNIANELTEP